MPHPGGVKPPGSNIVPQAGVAGPQWAGPSAPVVQGPQTSALVQAGVAMRPAPDDARATDLRRLGGRRCKVCGNRCRPFALTVDVQKWTPEIYEATHQRYAGPRDRPSAAHTIAEPPAAKGATMKVEGVPAWACHRDAYVGVEGWVQELIGIGKRRFAEGASWPERMEWERFVAVIQGREAPDALAERDI